MEQVPQRNNHVLWMAFGLPIMTTVIVMGSIYAGHVITFCSERATEVRVEAAAPKIDINVPQAAPPTVQVASAVPNIDVHVPAAPTPNVTINTPPQTPPQIIVNPPPAMVTVIDKRESDRAKPFVEPVQLAKAPEAPAVKAETVALKTDSAAVTPVAPKQVLLMVSAAPAKIEKPLADEEPTLDNLYARATQYIDRYCQKRGLDSNSEARRWNAMWRSNVEQAINDNIDSSEQSYINRIVIAKRDYFNMRSASPEKIVEACRILLRYRDGQLAWLQAMKDALTNDNLRKTMVFLAQGP